MPALRRAFVAVLLLLASTLSAATTTEYLATFGRVWGVVRYTHPYVEIGELQAFDDATIRAIEEIRQAGDTRAFLDATERFLATLGDRSTYVRRACSGETLPHIREPFLTPGGALFVPSGATIDAAAVQSVTHVIFDLRPRAGNCISPNPVDAVATHLFRGVITGPRRRTMLHRGYRSQNPIYSSNAYSSTMVHTLGETYPGTATAARHTTFIVDELSSMPKVAAAMVHADQASIISVGPFRDAAMAFRTVPLIDGWEARVRAEDPAQAVLPRVVLGADATENAIIAAAEQPAPRGGRRRSTRGAPPTSIAYEWKPDPTYPTMKYPDAAYRVLAAYRYWNVIQFFYPYKPLIEAWEPRLGPMIDKLLAVRSQSEYDLTIAELSTWVPDGHSFPGTAAWRELLGVAGPGFQSANVEGKVVVTLFTHDSPRAAGVALGDELLAIDGRPVTERLAELRRYISSSTEHNLAMLAALYAPRGAHGSQAVMRFRRPNGSEYEATLQRSSAWSVQPPATAWRVLEGNIGYVDVNWLEDQDYAAMKRDLGNTRAIIFDMRGYPRSNFFALADWVTTRPNERSAQIYIPNMLAGELTLDYREQATAATAGTYRGKVFLLVGERSQSAAEHFSLRLDAATNLTIVGAPTSGANGNVSTVALPGGIYVMFTGMDIRHGDGRQLQRVGVQPDVLVSPTIAGVAAGRDEVLEKALELARQ